jgi:hypothetical protein
MWKILASSRAVFIDKQTKEERKGGEERRKVRRSLV